MYRS
ncbi:hypothetical protein YPPY14_4674, partial [Yersinia pestis PY-14]